MLIGVSLKAYFGHAQTLAWAEAVAELAAKPAIADGTVELFVIPSFPELAEVGSDPGWHAHPSRRPGRVLGGPRALHG